MTQVAQVVALVVAAVNGAAGALGAWRWWTVSPSRTFWYLCRAGQVANVVQAAVAGVLAVRGFHPASNLYWIYAVVPVVLAFIAEQLKLSAAQTVLDARGLEDAQAVGRLDEAGQRSVVLAILRREMGILALAAVIIAFLALRAAGTA